jgi:hypothetical protein
VSRRRFPRITALAAVLVGRGYHSGRIFEPDISPVIFDH